MQKHHITNGFTLIEMLVVLTIIALLLSLVTPRYFDSISRSKETILKHDLATMREALDKFYSDKNAYPDSLEELVQFKYLRTIPEDPITESAATWVFSPPLDIEVKGVIYDIHSGSQETASDGSHYVDW
ncbi:MAG: prepilin-type N-terminal cleavage/methylation domain-containing protein [Methylotenera sp.]|uniref:type II secretion system protein n=1 Tax=Methylotenera sp. TaxID=2051956 RepID=UPI002486D25F|nr:prepilin-type N-terminal cleavage/methylation domain-containing protein [Methylotenera sp.]MDI1308931.1 prepilin-type N-terminal cleavage/methylation domain-containing protein [Methylotenera sp.]